MSEIFELKIRDLKNIYREVAEALAPHREKEEGSVLFIVEGTKENPVVGIRYPGRRVEKKKRGRDYKWWNLFDFAVVPFVGGKEQRTEDFTFEKLARDFHENKKDDEEFWELINEIYDLKEPTKKPPKLSGIDPELCLWVLKWIWIEEDFNYKLTCEDLGIEKGSPTSYNTKRRGGAGRGKQFAQLILFRSGRFTFDEIAKIIPFWG